MTHVLAFVDNSAAARPVFETASAVAPLFDASAEAVHVEEDGADSVAALLAGLGVPVRILHGDPVREIVMASSADDVVAVVVGVRDLPTGGRPVGHVAVALADAAPVPVLVVSPDAPITERPRRVLIAMKGTPRNARRLRTALRVAADAQLDIVVLHVDEPETIPRFSDQVQYEADAYAREFLRRHLPGISGARLENRVGSATEEILRAADEQHPDLVALGWSRPDDPGRSDVAREVLGRCRIPVLLVGTT
jgi:nucleotide-binding universal stress UspA family protein